MKNKIIRSLNLTLFIAFVLSLPLGYVLNNAFDFNLCYSDSNTLTYAVNCSDSLGTIGSVFFYLSLAGIWLSAVFIVFPKLMRSWLKFGIVATPIYLFLLYDAARPYSSSGPWLSPATQLIYYTALYLGASLGIIALSYILHRAKKQLPKFIRISLFILAAVVGAAIMWHLINPLIGGIELLMQQIFGR